MKKTFLTLAIAFVIACCLSSCEKVDSNRIPYTAVNIKLDNDGLWNTYGVSGFGSNRMFVKALKIPANYTYSALTYTGYGGVLLISGKNPLSDSYDTPLAYDLACPYEARPTVRVTINSNYEAECPSCKSRFNVTEGMGAPVYGKALEMKYGLKTYNVVRSQTGGYNITN